MKLPFWPRKTSKTSAGSKFDHTRKLSDVLQTMGLAAPAGEERKRCENCGKSFPAGSLVTAQIKHSHGIEVRWVCLNCLVGLIQDSQQDVTQPTLRASASAPEREEPVDGPQHIYSMARLATSRYEVGDLDGTREAEQEVLSALPHVSDPAVHPSLNAVAMLGQAHYRKGDFASARLLFEAVLEAETRILGPDHSDTLTTMSNFAAALASSGDLTSAQTVQQRLMDAQVRVLGAEHLHTLTNMTNLAKTMFERDNLAGAQSLLERAYEARNRLLGPEHPATLDCKKGLDAVRQAASSRH